MKKIHVFFLLVSLLAACNPNSYDETSRIELKKDPCFGVCPVYKFTVDGKGNARFTGIRNVAKQGEWKRTLSPSATNELFTAFEKSNFGQFKDEYTAQVTDLPTTWVSFRHGETDKTVKDFFGSPEALKNLEKMVETIAEEADGWERADSTSNQ
jgi:hypothetical protein